MKNILFLSLMMILTGCEEEGNVNVSYDDCDATVEISKDSYFSLFHTFICDKYPRYPWPFKYCNYVDYAGSRCKTLYYYKATNTPS
jgi:hypothetical protein